MREKIDSLQVVRALAFLGIFVHHSGIYVFSACGSWGVSVFLILSGFLMVYSYYDTGKTKECGIIYSLKFGIKKVKKLYLLHITTMLLTLVLLIDEYIRYSDLEKISLTVKVFLNTILLQSWIPDKSFYFSLNAVAWYLSTTLFIYIVFPFILDRMRKYKGINTAIINIVATYALQILMSYVSYLIQVNLIYNDTFMHWFVYAFPLSRLEDFVIGCNLGYIFINVKKDKELSDRLCTILEFGIIIIIAIQWVVHLVIRPEKWWSLSVLWTLSSCALVYIFAINRGKLSQKLTNKVMVLVGNLSGNCFLIHQVVYRYLDALERRGWLTSNEYINIFLCFIVTMVSAYLWDKLINTIINKKRETTIEKAFLC